MKKRKADEYDSQFDDHRDINRNEKTKYINEILSKLKIHHKLKNLDLNIVMVDLDATSLYITAMWDKSSVYPKKESDLLLNLIWKMFM